MGSPYVGEIRMFGGNFPPVGWMFCDGQLLPISQYETLFNLLGTTYGGDGQNTFQLPDLRGRAPIHQGTGPGLSPKIMGEIAGTESVTLLLTQIPAHSHAANGGAAGNMASPAGNFWSADGAGNVAAYSNASVTPSLVAAAAVGSAGGNQPHDNVQPFTAISFIISLFGIFPSQN